MNSFSKNSEGVDVMRKIFISSILLIALLLFAGCGNDNNNDKPSDNNNSNNNAANDEDSATISLMLNLHTPEVPNDRLIKVLEEEANVKLDIDWVPDNNYEERLNTAFSTNSLPQVILVKTDQFIQFKEAIRDDQFWEIGPYLDEFENLSKLREDTLDNQKVDDKLYSVYMGRPLSRHGIIYRKDWADALGLEAPTNTEEFFEMVKAFTENDPDDNGKDDTIGLTDREGLGTFQTIADWFGVPNNWGEKDGELLPNFMFPEYKEALEFFKEIHGNGYMNQDAPVTSKTDQQDMIKDGTAGVYIGSMQDVRPIYEDAKNINPNVEFDVHNYVEGPDGEYRTRSIPGYGSLVMFPKSAIENEDELKVILGFYDYLMSPEGANILIWGLEGEHYEVIDGKAQFIEGEEELIDREVRPLSALEVGEPTTNGRYEGYYDYEPLTKAYELYTDNENYLTTDPTIGLDSETFMKQSETLNQIIEDASINFILGDIDEEGFDAAIESWKNQGGNQVIEEYNESRK